MSQVHKKPVVFLFNGPPGSGKDAAVRALSQYNDISPLTASGKFSGPIKQALMATFWHLDLYNMTTEQKSMPVEILGGHSWREAQIYYSEKFMKPCFGEDIFGKLLLEKIDHESDYFELQAYFVSDSGFVSEAMPIIRAGYEVHVVQITRPGCTFEGDSRSYIEPPGTKMFLIANDGTLEEFERKVITYVEQVLSDHDNSGT